MIISDEKLMIKGFLKYIRDYGMLEWYTTEYTMFGFRIDLVYKLSGVVYACEAKIRGFNTGICQALLYRQGFEYSEILTPRKINFYQTEMIKRLGIGHNVMDGGGISHRTPPKKNIDRNEEFVKEIEKKGYFNKRSVILYDEREAKIYAKMQYLEDENILFPERNEG